MATGVGLRNLIADVPGTLVGQSEDRAVRHDELRLVAARE
jgi:hypothetical protein